MVFHKEAYKILENTMEKNLMMEEKNVRQKQLIKLIYNPSSAAPGFMTKNVISLPGVPSISNLMIENCKRYLVKGFKVHSNTINLFIQLKVISRNN